jgi:hypothetical protein
MFTRGPLSGWRRIDPLVEPLLEIYAPSGTGELCQGEILSDLVQAKLAQESVGAKEGVTVHWKLHPWAIIMSQDCDLDLDFKARSGQAKEDKLLPNVLFCEMISAEELSVPSEWMNSRIWDRVKRNKDERYQFLQRVQPATDALGEGLPELGIDFKRYFTIPTEEVYIQLKQKTRRRCKLVSPYLEHLCVRFSFYQCRVALPSEHVSE